MLSPTVFHRTSFLSYKSFVGRLEFKISLFPYHAWIILFSFTFFHRIGKDAKVLKLYRNFRMFFDFLRESEEMVEAHSGIVSLERSGALAEKLLFNSSSLLYQLEGSVSEAWSFPRENAEARLSRAAFVLMQQLRTCFAFLPPIFLPTIQEAAVLAP